MDEGKLPGPEASFSSLVPEEYRERAEKAPFSELTLEHLLTMSTGLEARDSYLYGWAGLGDMTAYEDWADFYFTLERRAEPGSWFDYSNTTSYMLSVLLSEAVGMSALDYGREKLFGPLGIEDVLWLDSPTGVSRGWAGLELRLIDLAKIGWLILERGEWEGRPIVSPQWIEASVSPHIHAGTLRDEYGYQWWIDEGGNIFGMGYQGQFLIISREKGMVAAFFSTLADHEFYYPVNLYYNFLDKAVLLE